MKAGPPPTTSNVPTPPSPLFQNLGYFQNNLFNINEKKIELNFIFLFLLS